MGVPLARSIFSTKNSQKTPLRLDLGKLHSYTPNRVSSRIYYDIKGVLESPKNIPTENRKSSD
jgi:hypothetical protein